MKTNIRTISGTDDMLRNADVGHILELRERIAKAESECKDAQIACSDWATRFEEAEAVIRRIAEANNCHDEDSVAIIADKFLSQNVFLNHRSGYWGTRRAVYLGADTARKDTSPQTTVHGSKVSNRQRLWRAECDILVILAVCGRLVRGFRG